MTISIFRCVGEGAMVYLETRVYGARIVTKKTWVVCTHPETKDVDRFLTSAKHVCD